MPSNLSQVGSIYCSPWEDFFSLSFLAPYLHGYRDIFKPSRERSLRVSPEGLLSSMSYKFDSLQPRPRLKKVMEKIDCKRLVNQRAYSKVLGPESEIEYSSIL